MGIWMMKIPLMDFEKKKNEVEDPVLAIMLVRSS